MPRTIAFKAGHAAYFAALPLSACPATEDASEWAAGWIKAAGY